MASARRYRATSTASAFSFTTLSLPSSPSMPARWSSWSGRTRTVSDAAPRFASRLAGSLYRRGRAVARQRSDTALPEHREFETALRESLDVPTARLAGAAPVAVPRRRFGLAFAAAAAVLVALIAGLIVWSGRVGQSDATVRSLAVLPLVDRSSARAVDVSDALTEQLIAALGQIQSLRTTTLGSTLPLKGSERPRTEIARQLGVDAVLEVRWAQMAPPDRT